MSLMLAKKALRVLRNEGMDVVLYKLKLRRNVRDLYKKWIAGNERNIMAAEPLEYNPLISVVIPVYNVADNMLRECIDSVLCQTYRNFEIILVDDASTQESVRTVLAEYDKNRMATEKRPEVAAADITVIYRSENGHISRCTNDGINAAKGEFVALCDCDDLYAPNALYEIVKKLNEDPSLDFIYTDEDKISEDGKVRRDPFFKPDWSPETFMSYMYTCHLSVYRKHLLDELGGLRVGFEGSQDYDLVLRVMEKTTRIGHVPKILYHWRMRQESTANSMTAKSYVMDSTRRAKEEALERRGLVGKLTLIPDIAQLRVTYIPQGNPLVSIIIPSKDNVPVLTQGLTSICNKTDYENYEILVVDNGSDEKNKAEIEALITELNQQYPLTGKPSQDNTGTRIRYIYEPMEFNFSRMCNIGAANAQGELLLFLNDDIEITEAVKKNPNLQGETVEWLSILAGQAQVSYTGAVGCKLYYPNTIRLQHAGVLNLQIGPGHCLYGSMDNLNYYYGRNLLDYNFSVVTGACLMVEKKKFYEVGGFDEDLPVAYNDVALCFKLVEAGYHNVLRNDVALVHHESVSRGLDAKAAEKEERRKREMEKLYTMHPKFAGGYDPCYNPNLTKDKGDFSFDMNNAILPSKPEHFGDKDMPGYIRCDNNGMLLVSNLESVVCGNDTVRASGWAYDARKKNNDHNKIELILKNGENSYKIPTGIMYRNDIVRPGRKGPTRRGTTLVGFETVFLKEKIKPGKYQVGIALHKMYTMYESYVEI